jgi:scyllo-inositol 2-dehydrogenase (NADP+)
MFYMRKINMAIVGFGGMGGFHKDFIIGQDFLELKGIYDIDPARAKAAADEGIYAYSSLDELLDDRSVELVTVATPNDVHCEIAVKLMKSGKNVICEKPVAMSSKELETMIKTAESCKVLFTVHQNRRWDEDFLIMKKIFDENTLGEVFNIESRVHGSRGIPGDWRNQKEHGGGMVLDWGVHLIDQIMMMTAPRKLKSVYARLFYITNEQCDDGFKTIFTFDDGLSAQIEVGTSNFISLPRWYMQGRNGTAVINGWDCSGKITMVSDWENRDAVPVVTAAGLTKTMAPRTEETIKDYPLPKVHSDWGDFYRNVYKTLLGEETQIITHSQVQRVFKIMEAIFESAEKDEVIKLDI